MAKALMIQGTMSNAGKSILTAGLCRIFRQDGFRVCPFKAQNMALNSYVTREGLEMGRAQAVQAEAAGIEPSVLMNPVLIKPNSDTGSQIIVGGEVRETLTAVDYYRKKAEFIPDIMESYRLLAERNDIMVIEGAGSPAEINLRENDLVNMGMAQRADAGVLLVGDIDRGGVFAQLYGTVELLEPEERARIFGLIVNKFRGDPEILKPGLSQLESLTGIPVAGVVPYMKLHIDDEDSLSERLHGCRGGAPVKIAVIRLPRLSNFTDFDVFEQFDEVSLYYPDSADGLRDPDLIILPGTKTTIADLKWLKSTGLDSEILKAESRGIPVFGICGGYQMLGRRISDPDGVEGGGSVQGLGLLPAETVFSNQKFRSLSEGTILSADGVFRSLSGRHAEGYEIHNGRTRRIGPAKAFCRLSDGSADGMQAGSVYGTYLHGIFDADGIAGAIVSKLLEKKGIQAPKHSGQSRVAFRERQYDHLAAELRKNLDMDLIYRKLGITPHSFKGK